MNKTWVILGISILFLILLGAGLFFYFKGYSLKIVSKTSPTPASVSSVTPSLTPAGSPTPTLTASPSEQEKTVKDVHCLQKPQKGETIKVTSPEDYSIESATNLTFQGTANVFEGEFRFRLKDCRGPVLSEGSVTTTGEGETPIFSKTISVTLSRSPMDVILELFEISAASGSEINLTQVPLRLTQ